MAKKTLEIKDLAAGESYDLQVRAINEEIGLPSNWSLTLNFTTNEDTQGPGNVVLTTPDPLKAVGAAFRVTWNPVALDGDGGDLNDLKDYKVTWIDTGTPSNTFTTYTESLGSTLTYQQNVEELGGVAQVTVEVVARDYANNESAVPSSATVTNVAPTVFTGLTSERDEADSAAIAVEWPQPNGSAADGSDNGDDIVRYDIYRDSVKIEDIAFSPGVTRHLDPDPRPGTHTYYVIAYDAYGNSIQSNSDTATPIYADVGNDTIAPGPPSGLTLTPGTEVDDRDNPYEGFIDVTFTPPTTNVDASGYLDNEGFIVRWRLDGGSDFYERYVADVRDDSANDTTPITTQIEGLNTGFTYEVSVAAFDTSRNLSTFVTDTAVVAADLNAPDQPVAPTVTSDAQSVLISHDLGRQAGGTLANDVVEFSVHASTTNGFTADDTNKKLTMQVIPNNGSVGTWHIANTEDTQNSGNPLDWYFVVKAIDANGNVSPQSPQVSATPDLISGAQILNATIGDAKIDNLSANKLTAGSAFVNDLFIQSKIEVDAGGYLSADTWDGTPGGTNSTAGWWIGDDGVVINDGTVEANAFATREQNVVPYKYAIFPNYERWYQDNLWTTGDNANIDLVANPWKRYGFQSIEWSSIDSDNLYLGTSPTDYNVQVEPNARYVYSAYVRNEGLSSVTIELVIVNDAAQTFVSGAQVIAPSTTERVFFDWSGSASTSVLLGFANANAGAATVLIDGVQLEQVSATAEGVPGLFTIPGGTVIEGNSITTGEIESNNFLTGVSGWKIDMLGDVEFRDGLFRGEIIAQSGQINGDLTVGANLILDDPLAGTADIYIGDNVYAGTGTVQGINFDHSQTGTADNIWGKFTNGDIVFRVGDKAAGGAYLEFDNVSEQVTIKGNIQATTGNILGDLTIGDAATYRSNIIGITGETDADLYVGADILVGSSDYWHGINFNGNQTNGSTAQLNNFWGKAYDTPNLEYITLFLVGEKKDGGSYIRYDSRNDPIIDIGGELKVTANLKIPSPIAGDTWAVFGNDIIAANATGATGINLNEDGVSSNLSDFDNFWGLRNDGGRVVFTVGEKSTGGNYIQYDSSVATSLVVKGDIEATSGNILGDMNVGANLILDDPDGGARDIYIGDSVFSSPAGWVGINFDRSEGSPHSNFWARDSGNRIVFRVGRYKTNGAYLEFDSAKGDDVALSFNNFAQDGYTYWGVTGGVQWRDYANDSNQWTRQIFTGSWTNTTVWDGTSALDFRNYNITVDYGAEISTGLHKIRFVRSGTTDKLVLSANDEILFERQDGVNATMVVTPDNSTGGVCRPAYNNGSDLGMSGIGWGDVYSWGGIVSPSSGTLKKDVADSTLGLAFINDLRPVKYKSKVGTSGRDHYGFIAQEVKGTIDDLGIDFGGFVNGKHKWKNRRETKGVSEEDMFALRYHEFIAPMVKAIQELSAKVEELEKRGN